MARQNRNTELAKALVRVEHTAALPSMGLSEDDIWSGAVAPDERQGLRALGAWLKQQVPLRWMFRRPPPFTVEVRGDGREAVIRFAADAELPMSIANVSSRDAGKYLRKLLKDATPPRRADPVDRSLDWQLRTNPLKVRIRRSSGVIDDIALPFPHIILLLGPGNNDLTESILDKIRVYLPHGAVGGQKLHVKVLFDDKLRFESGISFFGHGVCLGADGQEPLGHFRVRRRDGTEVTDVILGNRVPAGWHETQTGLSFAFSNTASAAPAFAEIDLASTGLEVDKETAGRTFFLGKLSTTEQPCLLSRPFAANGRPVEAPSESDYTVGHLDRSDLNLTAWWLPDNEHNGDGTPRWHQVVSRRHRDEVAFEFSLITDPSPTRLLRSAPASRDYLAVLAIALPDPDRSEMLSRCWIDFDPDGHLAISPLLGCCRALIFEEDGTLGRLLKGLNTRLQEPRIDVYDRQAAVWRRSERRNPRLYPVANQVEVKVEKDKVWGYGNVRLSHDNVEGWYSPAVVPYPLVRVERADGRPLGYIPLRHSAADIDGDANFQLTDRPSREPGEISLAWLNNAVKLVPRGVEEAGICRLAEWDVGYGGPYRRAVVMKVDETRVCVGHHVLRAPVDLGEYPGEPMIVPHGNRFPLGPLIVRYCLGDI